MLPILVLLMTMFQPAATAQTSPGVYVATYIDVQLNSAEQGIALIKQYREAGRMEPGNSRVEVFRGIARPNQFVIVEVWKDQSSFDAHERAEHTAQFRARLKAIHNSPFDQRIHSGFAIDPRPAVAGRDSVSVATHVDVPPQRREETEVLLKALAEESRKDEGSVRYDVFQQAAARNHFTIYAVWRDRKAFDSHEMKPHTRQFRESLGPLLGAPYDERLFTAVP
jgi:quinol monooxygenase YgiN